MSPARTSRRASLPTAEDLFRATGDPGSRAARDIPAPVRAVADDGHPDEAAEPAAVSERKPSGRVRHEEKMTVYVSAGELHDLETTRLTLRAAHGIRVDRGRLVREAMAAVLADFEARGADSVLVQRLSEA